MALPGYNFYRRDRPSMGGGIIVYYKSELPCQRAPTLESPDIEGIWFRCKLGDIAMEFYAVYWPPCNATDITDHVATVLGSIPARKYSGFLMLGDLNAKHRSWRYCSTTNSAGILLNDFFTMHDMTQVVTTPTRLDPDSILDFVVTNIPSAVRFISTDAPIGTADHLVVNFEINKSTPNNKIAGDINRIAFPVCFEDADWRQMNVDFSNIAWDTVLPVGDSLDVNR